MENNVIEQVFGKDVFNDEVMQAKLPKDVFKSCGHLSMVLHIIHIGSSL